MNSSHRPAGSERGPTSSDLPPAMDQAAENGSSVADNLQRRLFKASSLGLIAAVLLAFGFGVVVGSSGHNLRLDAVPELPSMGQCMAETLAVLDLKQAPTPAILREALEHCYALIQSQG